MTLFGVALCVFLLIRWIPGDPVDTILGDLATPLDRARWTARFHLDESLLAQFGYFLEDVLNGTLGSSFRSDEPVASLIAEVAGSTVKLALASLLVAWGIGIPMGLFAASRQQTRSDRMVSTFSALGLAIPTIWLAPLLILLFGVTLRVLPLPGDEESPLALVLPAITLGTALAASMQRQTRGAVIDALAEPFSIVARAKGLPERTVLFRAFRTGALPVLTIAAAQLGALLSGTVVIETLFERQGLGSLFLSAFFSRDIPIIQGCVLIIASTYVLINLLLDLAYAWVDPRVRFS